MVDFVNRFEGLRCPDCAVAVGEPHEGGCDVARCKECGEQALTCWEHDGAPATIWRGEWPGEREAAERGVWVLWLDPKPGEQYGRWVDVEPGTPCAQPSLNAFAVACARGEYVWGREEERWLKAT